MKMRGRIYPTFGISVLHEPLRIPLFVRLRQNNLLRSLRHACATRHDVPIACPLGQSALRADATPAPTNERRMR